MSNYKMSLPRIESMLLSYASGFESVEKQIRVSIAAEGEEIVRQVDSFGEDVQKYFDHAASGTASEQERIELLNKGKDIKKGISNVIEAVDSINGVLVDIIVRVGQCKTGIEKEGGHIRHSLKIVDTYVKKLTTADDISSESQDAVDHTEPR